MIVDNSREVRRQIYDVIGCIAAFVTIVAYLVLCINATWSFIPEGSFVMNVLQVIKTWAPLVVVAIVGAEYVADKNVVFRVMVYLMIALVVVFMFFPGTWNQVVGIISK
ncbi:MAG: hypothetical protein IJX17_05865 [Clostridia bacterium]|nr:hypothetical protein [Clostridia bacterium]